MKAIAAFSDFVGRSFAIWVIVFAALGFVMPATFSIFAPWIVVLLGIIMFGMGLTISGKDFAEVAKGRSMSPSVCWRSSSSCRFLPCF